jgi:hypothetical protein
MEKDELFVDNPLALVSLFSNGIYKRDMPQADTNAEAKTEAESEPSIEAESSETTEVKTTPQPTLPLITQSVVHVLNAEGREEFIQTVIPNTMKALNKLNLGISIEVQIIDEKIWSAHDLNEWKEHVSEQTRIISWGVASYESPYVLKLSTPEQMLETKESKAEHWAQIKRFFEV